MRVPGRLCSSNSVRHSGLAAACSAFLFLAACAANGVLSKSWKRLLVTPPAAGPRSATRSRVASRSASVLVGRPKIIISRLWMPAAWASRTTWSA